MPGPEHVRWWCPSPCRTWNREDTPCFVCGMARARVSGLGRDELVLALEALSEYAGELESRAKVGGYH